MADPTDPNKLSSAPVAAGTVAALPESKLSWGRKRRLAAQRAAVEPAANPPATPKPEDLKKLVDDSSTKNRNFFMAYFALLIYVLVLTLGVSDKQLLLDQREIAIPLLSLGLTPSIWFVVAPFALFIMHLDMVLNLAEHMRKLVDWRTARGGTVAPRDMQPFFVDFAFAHGVSDALGKAFYFMLWFTVGVLGPLTLLIVLIKFGRYQSMPTSVLHFVFLIADLVVAWRFIRAWRAQAFARPKKAWGFGLICVLQGGIGLASIVLTSVCVYPVWLERVPRIDGVSRGKLFEKFKEFGVAPVLSVPNTVLVSVDSAEKQALELLSQRHVVGQGPSSGRTSAATSDASTISLGLADLWWQHGSKLELSARHLNFANLRGSLMPRVVLNGAQLQWATLSEAQLQGADLNGARLQGAFLHKAQLQGGLLNGAQLQGALLSQAQLQGAKLRDAQLQGADLNRAQLQGADLNGAQLQEVDLRGTNLQGAYLRGTQLQGSACRPTNAVKFAEPDTNWTLCDPQNWRTENVESAMRGIDQLGKTLPAKTLSQITKRVQVVVGMPAAAEAICGKLTQQMVDVINATRHSGGVPEKTRHEWAEAGSPCPIPGQKPPPVPEKSAAKSR